MSEPRIHTNAHEFGQSTEYTEETEMPRRRADDTSKDFIKKDNIYC